MPLFEVAIIEKPTKKDAEDGKGERIIMSPKAVIAADGQSAAISAVLDSSQPLEGDRARWQVLVRPFG